MFPQFPLAKPVQPCEQEVDDVQAVSNQPLPVTMRSTQPSIPDVATSSGQANRSYISLPRYSPYLPPIDRTRTGQEFFAHLKDERIIAGTTKRALYAGVTLRKMRKRREPSEFCTRPRTSIGPTADVTECRNSFSMLRPATFTKYVSPRRASLFPSHC